MRRNTVYNVSLHERLEIPCPVKFCQYSKKYIMWSKLEGNLFSKTTITDSSHISTDLIMSSSVNWTLYLKFNSIQVNDSGFYQCSSGHAVSFKITVFVSGELDFFTAFHLHTIMHKLNSEFINTIKNTNLTVHPFFFKFVSIIN